MPLAETNPPWWLTSILVPLLIGALGSTIPLFITEFVRRRSRWEAYAESLWTERMRLYAAIVRMAREAHVKAHHYHTMPRGSEERASIRDAYDKIRHELMSLDAERLILLSEEFNSAYNALEQSLFKLTHLPDEEMAIVDLAIKQRVDLVNAARRSLGIKKLDQRSCKLLAEETGKPNTPPSE